MECKGKLTAASRDFRTGQVILTFAVTCPAEAIEGLEDKDLRIKAVRWREKRSLDANAYLWVLCTKIAEKMPSATSNEEIYEQLLKDYGTLQQDEDGNYIVMMIPSKISISAIPGHWMEHGQSPDGKRSRYLMIKGSSDYDTKEMSRLIDGAVQEAKELGIETATPEELERMKATWGNR